MKKLEDITILVVEDEPDVQMFLEATLEDGGFTVRTASDGHEAYNQVKQGIPDLITLDLVMPRNSGSLFYRKLKKNTKWQNVPVIIITAHAHDDLGEEDFKELMKGKDVPKPEAYLEKPVKPFVLLRTVAEVLGLPIEDVVDDATEGARGELLSKLKGADLETLKKVADVLK